MAKEKVFIATPIHGKVVHADYMLSILETTVALMQSGYDVTFQYKTSSDVATNRNILCREAIALGQDYILFCDADMAFDKNDVLAMLRAGKDCIGAAYARKHFASLDLMINAKDVPLGDILANTTVANFERPEAKDFRQGQVVKTSHVGTGLMLIRTAILQQLITDGKVRLYTAHNAGRAHNFFQFNFESEGSVGEDYHFCELVRAAGYDVWLYVTDRVRHFGEHAFQLAIPR